MVVIEKRKADGSLDFSGEQAPVGGMKFDDVYKLYFHANPSKHQSHGDTASWEQLRAWLESKGWCVRAKTW